MTNPRDTQEPQTPIVSKQLKHGVSIVDACDSDLLERACSVLSKWGCTYAQINFNKKTRGLHRLILERVIGRELSAGEQVDHINRDGLDNRRANLRIATSVQNHGNTRLNKANKSGYKGVSWQKSANKWVAGIKMNRKRIHLGCFDDPAKAHEAYMAAARAYFGEFASDGKPDK